MITKSKKRANKTEENSQTKQHNKANLNTDNNTTTHKRHITNNKRTQHVIQQINMWNNHMQNKTRDGGASRTNQEQHNT